MSKKTHNKKKKHPYRRYIAWAFALYFLAMLIGFGILQAKVYLENNRTFSVQIENDSMDQRGTWKGL